jgi:hypothetical protein
LHSNCFTYYLIIAFQVREEYRLRVFENRVLRSIFGQERDEVTGGWGKLYNEKLHNLYSTPSKIIAIKSRRLRWAGNVARMLEKRDSYRILVEKPGGKRLLGRPRCRLVDNSKMYVREIGWGGMKWIDLAQDRN